MLQCDIQQFFPAIDHQILIGELEGRIKDQQVLNLAKVILSSGESVHKQIYKPVYFPGDNLLGILRPRGLPIGNLTSQFWANVYLNPFDQFVRRQLGCRQYIRYVDDFLLFSQEKTTLWNWKSQIHNRMQRLRLTIHPGAHPRPVTEGIPFLGFVVFPQRRRLKRRKGIHFRRRLKKLLNCFAEGELSAEQLKQSINGWINHVRYGNTIGLQKAVLSECPANHRINLRQ